MKTGIVSHKNCPDGATAVLFARLVEPQIQFQFSNHDEINDVVLKMANAIEEGGKLWITDIVCDQKVVEQVFDILKPKNAELTIYEHHVSREWVETLQAPKGMKFKSIFDKSRCGSKIFYDEHSKATPNLKEYKEICSAINDRDLWINKDERGKLLARLHHIYDDQLFMERLLINPSFDLQEKEKVLFDFQYRVDEKRIREFLKQITIKEDSNGFRYGVIYGHGQSTDVLDRALHEKGLEYVLLLNLNDKRAHLRSLGNFNCAEYAAARNGGGHRCAAGFPLEFQQPEY